MQCIAMTAKCRGRYGAPRERRPGLRADFSPREKISAVPKAASPGLSLLLENMLQLRQKRAVSLGSHAQTGIVSIPTGGALSGAGPHGRRGARGRVAGLAGGGSLKMKLKVPYLGWTIF